MAQMVQNKNKKRTGQKGLHIGDFHEILSDLPKSSVF